MWSSTVRTKLEEAVTTRGNTSTVTVMEGAVRVQVVVQASDQLALSLRGLHLHLPDSSDDLVAIGRTLSGRITYLLEPLILLEHTEDQVLLRSAAPRHGDDTLDFYELWVRRRAGGMTVDFARVRRDRAARGHEVIPATVTWETLGFLLADLERAMM